MEKENSNLRKYGAAPYRVVVVHGGPGAPGEMKSVAKELSLVCGVLEPLQTADTIDGQVEELRKVVKDIGTPPVTLIGWSWGAWLSYLVAGYYPELVKNLILVSSGPFEEKYAKEIMSTRLQRLSLPEREKVEKIMQKLQDGKRDDNSFKEFGELMDKADSFDPLPKTDNSEVSFQAEIYEKVWGEAANLRTSGELLRFGKNIRCPVVAIHGDYDPHPYTGVQEPLSKVLQDFRFTLLKNCGHHPWQERKVKDGFYEIVKKELS